MHAALKANTVRFAANVMPIIREIQASGACQPERDCRSAQCPQSGDGSRRQVDPRSGSANPRPYAGAGYGAMKRKTMKAYNLASIFRLRGERRPPQWKIRIVSLGVVDSSDVLIS
jgi:hypothetical protein